MIDGLYAIDFFMPIILMLLISLVVTEAIWSRYKRNQIIRFVYSDLKDISKKLDETIRVVNRHDDEIKESLRRNTRKKNESKV